MSPRDFLSPQQVSALKREHKLIGTRRHADRLKAILMLNRGRSYEEIANDLRTLMALNFQNVTPKFSETRV